jgi:CheY-like chemotaxis protein
MIFSQEATNYYPGKEPCQSRATATAVERRELPASAYMIAQGGEAIGDKEPARVSPSGLQPHGAPSRRGDVRQATVLIVDDEESVRETLVELLSIHGYRAITAANVEDAAETKQRLDVGGIHLVITDIHLTPGRQLRAGYGLAQRWHTQQLGLPIILISGDSSNQDLPRVRDGSLRFIRKPFRMEAFLQVLREALSR